MADHSSQPEHGFGSEEVSDDFHLAQEWLDDGDDDENDMDYEPEHPMVFFDPEDDDDGDEEEEQEEEEEEEESLEDSDDDFQGPGAASAGIFRDDQGNIQIELTMGPLTDEQAGGDDDDSSRQLRVTPAQILQLLQVRGLNRIFQSHGILGRGLFAVDDDNDDGHRYGSSRSRRRRENRAARHAFPKVPSENGVELMNSGFYGNNPDYVDVLKRRKRKLATRMMWRELGIGTSGQSRRDARLVVQGMIPETPAERIIHYNARSYSGQFSDDGNFFFCCSQDFKVRMYDTSNPHDWKYYKTVRFIGGQWTITDATLSPDNRYVAISSIQRQVTLAPTDPNDTSDPMLLNFSTHQGQSFRRVGIWSLRFSGDGKEIVAGTSDQSVVVYDVEKQQPILELKNHEDEVNAVCFGDSSSPHILYSGSDDTTIRVWDRRSMNDNREAGAFVGHTEGLTFVDSKGDGRYVLSNGKDQMMKLWDLRKMCTTEQLDNINLSRYTTGFDYRYMTYSDEDYSTHPHDCSVVTYRGHSVMKTLIRCHFSPPSSTNSRYVYSGSEDGKVYIYNIDATLAGVIDVESATANSRPLDRDLYAEFEIGRGDNAWKTCVRDASWHPSAPILAATSWNGWGSSYGTCSVHSWNDSATQDEGDPPMGLSFDEKLNYHREFNATSEVRYY